MDQGRRKCSSNKLGLVKLTEREREIESERNVVTHLVIIVDLYSDLRRSPLDVLLPAVHEQSVHQQQLVPGWRERLVNDLRGPAALSYKDPGEGVREAGVVQSYEGPRLVDVSSQLEILKIKSLQFIFKQSVKFEILELKINVVKFSFCQILTSKSKNSFKHAEVQ